MNRGFGSATNPRDGDLVKIEVDLEGGVVMEVRANASGCEASTKASQALTRFARGRDRNDSLGIGASDLLAQSGPVDEEQACCVLAAIGALRAAIVDAQTRAIA